MASNRGPTPADISLFVELSRALVAVSVRSVGAIDGVVTLPQFRALAVLERRGPCSAGELATGVGLHVSSITRLCDRLVDRGLITRETRPDNRRQVELTITDEGSKLVQQVWAARAVDLAEALSALTTAERTALRDAVAPLLAVLAEDEAPSGRELAWG